MILFEGAHLERLTEVELSPDAAFPGVETVVLGRVARGETLTRARLSDLRRVRVAGALLHEEHLDIGPGALGDRAALGGMRAFATLTMVGPGAVDALEPLRAVLGSECHASAWDGRLVARLMATDAAPLRRALIRAIVALRGRPMPRVWQCEGSPARGPATEVPDMNLTPREKDKLLVSLAAMVARGRLARGVKLNHPEAMP